MQAKEWGIAYIPTSSKSGKNVDHLFDAVLSTAEKS